MKQSHIFQLHENKIQIEIILVISVVVDVNETKTKFKSSYLEAEIKHYIEGL